MKEHDRCRWKGDALHYEGRATGFSIVVDDRYSTMWRVRYPDGKLTDMVNRTRAKDAAQSIFITRENRRP